LQSSTRRSKKPAARSATIITAGWMLLDGASGITEASAIRTASSDEQVRAAYA